MRVKNGVPISSITDIDQCPLCTFPAGCHPNSCCRKTTEQVLDGLMEDEVLEWDQHER